MDPLIGQMFLQVVLIALNAVFACAEISIISLDELMLKKQVEKGEKRAEILLKLLGQPTKFLATIQIGITLAGFLGSAFAADNFASRLSAWLLSLGLNSSLQNSVNTISVLLITLLLSYVTLIFGELVPKRIAMKNAAKISLGLANFINFISVVTTPVVNFLNFSTNLVLRLLGINPEDDQEEVTEEQIRALLEASSESGNINPEERTMIENIFEFDDRTASEIMVHRIDMNVLWIEDNLTVWEETFVAANNSVLPICDDNIDDVKGTLSLKIFYNALSEGVTTVEEMLKRIKKPYFVPETITIDVLFENMQRTKNRFVFVLDEYGGLSGIATISDVLEEIVGDFDDEEEKEPELIKLSDTSWKVKGTMSLNDLSAATNIAFAEGDFDTLGGLVVNEIKSIPTAAKDILPIEKDGYRITVKSVKLRRVDYAILEKITEEKETDEVSLND